MFKRFLEGYFGFTKQQRNGLFVLACISLILLIIRLVFPFFIHPDPIEIKNLPLLPIEKDSIKRNELTVQKNNYKILQAETVSELFEFNPNKVSYDQLLKLGLTERVAKTFIKLRNKGFHYKKREDLKKVYGLNEEMYQALLPYIRFEANAISTNNKKITNPNFDSQQFVQKTERTIVQNKLELNSADSIQLQNIKGIDGSTARRIIRFRNRLGGFTALNQLKEVYGIDNKVFNILQMHCTVSDTEIRKFNPNKVSFKEMSQHPYIGNDLAKLISNWRNKTILNETNLAEFINDPALYKKLQAYLIFE